MPNKHCCDNMICQKYSVYIFSLLGNLNREGGAVRHGHKQREIYNLIGCTPDGFWNEDFEYYQYECAVCFCRTIHDVAVTSIDR